MYYSYVEFEYVATSFSPARTDLAVKLLSGKALMYQQYLESKQNDTTMNVPGDNVVTDVISPRGGGSHDKSNGPIVLPSDSPLSGKNLLYQHDLEKGKDGKYRTGKLASSVTS